MKRTLTLASALFLLVVGLILRPAVTAAAPEPSHSLLYTTRLLDGSGAVITMPVTMRFSFWKSADLVAGDVSDGVINTSADEYSDWQEAQDLTPGSNGYVVVNVGDVTPLPDFDSNLIKYMQVEVKGAAQGDAAYQLLDPTGDDGADTIDRKPMNSFSYAQNAAAVQGREPGTGSGNLVILSPSGVIGDAQMGDGTNGNNFDINADNSSGDATLTFGNTVTPATVTFSEAHDRFEFSDDVYISGDLTVSGTINGLSSAALQSAVPLMPSLESGLNIHLAAGSYRLDGTLVQFNGQSGLAVADNTINYIYFTSTGIHVTQSGFPTSESYIPIAQAVTLNGSIVTLQDVRALQNDDRGNHEQLTLHPPFDGSSTKGDGSNNVGMLYVNIDDATQKNYYLWTTTQATMQDFDINVPVTLPLNFASWTGDPLTLNYRSTTGSATDNKLDLTVLDTAGNPVTLSGSSSDLASATWASTTVDFSGSPTWTPGQTVWLKLKVSALNHNEMHIGSIELHYDSLQGM